MTSDTRKPSPRLTAITPPVVIPQYSAGRTLAIWASAALPMGFLAWVAALRLAALLDGPEPMARSLVVLLTAGLVWQFVLVVFLIRREQGTLRWDVVRQALWLRAPESPRTGRVGGRVWLVVIPLTILFYGESLIPGIEPVAGRDFGAFLGSEAGEAFFHGAWGWYAVLLVMSVFNTVLGEELLFRGLLLPRMSRTFGRFDWLVNGVLFAAYHLHMPWAMPRILLDSLLLAYPTRRYRSAWVGIAVHSAQSVFFAVAVLALVT